MINDSANASFFSYDRCPWDRFPPSTLKFCEATTCSWIAEPLNAFSCLLFVFLGVAIALNSRKQDKIWIGYGISSILVGVLSLVYHATITYFGEVLDLASMFFLIAWVLGRNLQLLSHLSPVGDSRRPMSDRLFHGIVVGLVGISLGLLALLPVFGIFIFAALILSSVGLHWVFLRRSGQRPDFTCLKYLAVTFCSGFAFWVLDVTRIWCPAGNLSHMINGHFIWHVLNTLCVLWLFLYLRQFKLARS